MKRHLGLIALVAVSLGAAARDVTGLAVAQGAERPALPIHREGGICRIEVPSIGAWNGGVLAC